MMSLPSISAADAAGGVHSASLSGLVELVHVPSAQVIRPIRSCMSVKSLDDSLRAPSFPSRSSRNQLRHRLSVSFDTLEIRDYERILGDNPSCSCGPSITFGWRYAETSVLPVDDYECRRLPRRRSYQMVMPQPIREEMLLNSGHTRSEIMFAVRGNNLTKRGRQKTLNTLGLQKVQEITQSARRKFRRLFVGRAEKRRVEEWKVEAEQARIAIQAEYEAADAAAGGGPPEVLAGNFLLEERLPSLRLWDMSAIIGAEEEDVEDPTPPTTTRTEDKDSSAIIGAEEEDVEDPTPPTTTRTEGKDSGDPLAIKTYYSLSSVVSEIYRHVLFELALFLLVAQLEVQKRYYSMIFICLNIFV